MHFTMQFCNTVENKNVLQQSASGLLWSQATQEAEPYSHGREQRRVKPLTISTVTCINCTTRQKDQINRNRCPSDYCWSQLISISLSLLKHAMN